MDNILQSFTVRPSLYSDIWENPSSDNFKEIKLKKEIREHLIAIAKDFIDSLGIDTLAIEDILFVGSLANYNWSEYSDIDLHIVIDKPKVNDDSILVDEFFTAKKELYNLKHNIKIKGFDVELYVQAADEVLDTADGIYSILYNKWRKEPNKQKPEINKKDIIKKVKEFNQKLIDINNEEDPDAKILKLKKLKEKIRKIMNN